MAYREDRLERVSEAWQTIAAFPRAFVIIADIGEAFLVLMSARYAVRTWEGRVEVRGTNPRTPTGCGGDRDGMESGD
eukprot:7015922-Lingulodinium_polyedra.AAC.1